MMTSFCYLLVACRFGLLECSLSAVEDGLRLSLSGGSTLGIGLAHSVLLHSGGVDTLGLGGAAAGGSESQRERNVEKRRKTTTITELALAPPRHAGRCFAGGRQAARRAGHDCRG